MGERENNEEKKSDKIRRESSYKKLTLMEKIILGQCEGKRKRTILEEKESVADII